MILFIYFSDPSLIENVIFTKFLFFLIKGKTLIKLNPIASNSLISIGQGGWLGVGLGNSFQKSFFLPEAHTDFIFAILIEELGILGGLILISLYVTLFIGLLSIAFDSFKKSRLFQGYTIFGIFLLVVIQVFFNIAVNIGLLPTKGLTLPFISYGGTSIIIMLSLMGIVLRINNENKLL